MKRSRLTAIILLAGDVFIFYLSLYLALFLRKFSLPDARLYESLKPPFLYLFISWAVLLFIFDFYEAPFFKRKTEILKRTLLFIVFSLLFGTAYFYLQPDLQLTPRAILILTVINSTVLVLFWRYLLSFLIGGKRLREKVIIIGSCSDVEEIIDKDLEHLGYEVVAVFSKREVVSGTIKIIRNFFELEEEAKKADIAILAPEAREDKEFVRRIFASLPLKINYMEFCGFYEEVTRKVPLYSVDELWFLENISRPKRKVSELIKRAGEIVIAVLGITFTLLLFPFIALAVKLSSKGPVFYKQARVGAGKRKFFLYKFRTMKNNPDREDVLWREKKNGEITPVGRFLRNSHLDELPQFYNLLKGDIAVVGPRPEWEKIAHIFEKEIPFYDLRYLVRPGITGWAQLHYPASTSVDEAKEKFKYDLYYIKNRSLFLDFIILLKTLRTVF